MATRLRLVGRDQLEIDVDGRLVQVDGELLLPTDGRSGFWLMSSTRWRWVDGAPMSESERLHLVEMVPQIGAEEGWALELDEGPWPTPLPITSLFEFKGQNRLVWTSGPIVIAVPGKFSLQGGRPAFAMDMSGEWTGTDGQRLSQEEINELAIVIRNTAPANGVVITTSGRPQDMS